MQTCTSEVEASYTTQRKILLILLAVGNAVVILSLIFLCLFVLVLLVLCLPSRVLHSACEERNWSAKFLT